MKQSKTKGFTLIELLVVIAVIGILAAILVPAVTKVIQDAKWTEMKTNGKNIYTSVLADEVDGGTVGFPHVNYALASDYFKVVAGRVGPTPAAGGAVGLPVKVLASGPDYYSAPGGEATSDWNLFNSTYCGWSMVAGNDESADAGTPFLLSRNVTASTVATMLVASPPSTVMVDTDLNLDLTKRDRACIAFHGGGAEVFKVNRATMAQMNPAGFNIGGTSGGAAHKLP